LYKDISARVLINGFLSDKINIERGVKQGDALSCAIFILCIDPLLRNINADKDIKIVEVITRISRQQVNYKAGGFADDINVICGGDRGSEQRIFVQYERLTKRSGLTLNADKTEILALHTEDIIEYEVEYEGVDLKIKTVDELKICGIWYCSSIIKEYKRNITEKIEKLENKIRMWNARNLTFEGKILIVKTFGISQLIYVLQVCGLKEGCSKVIEKIIFGFIWKAQGNNGARGIDRIKRSILKNKYVEGGLNVTDIECLDRSLKTRQYIRASRSKHPIHMVQLYCVEDGGNKSSVMQRYNKISTRESITMVAQSTINLLDDVIKSKLIENFEMYSGDKIAIGYAGQ
jgi:predicted nucleic acid-binding OB-fold protein